MSRISDTRQRTREAAAKLIATGYQPYKLTVDLIYAEIRQGSRTTINDELKLWKDNQAKASILNSALPPEVSNAMMSIWASAVEHGAKAFEQRRDEVEGELIEAQKRIQAFESSLEKADSELSVQQSQLYVQKVEIETLHIELGNSRATAEAAQTHADMLRQQFESCQADAEQRLNEAQTKHQQQLAELQKTMEEKEKTFRMEIGMATERLEGVQKHVMLQVTEAREATKHAETALVKVNRHNEALITEVQDIKSNLAAQAQHTERSQINVVRLNRELDQLKLERELLLQQLATINGKLEVRTEQTKSLEQRAIYAERRLETLLRQTNNKKSRIKPVYRKEGQN